MAQIMLKNADILEHMNWCVIVNEKSWPELHEVLPDFPTVFVHIFQWYLSWKNWHSLRTLVSWVRQLMNVCNVKISHVNWFRAQLFQNVRPDPERHSNQFRICVCLVAWPEHHEGAGGAPGQGEDRTDKGDPLGRCWCARAQHYHHLKRVRSRNKE